MTESTTCAKQAKEREEKHPPPSSFPAGLNNHLGHSEIPDLLNAVHGLNLMSMAGKKNGSESASAASTAAAAAAASVAVLEEEFRWKELFAEIQQRNETPAFMVYKSLPRDHLLEAQMEHFLETYIRRHLAPSKQRQLEVDIRRKLLEMDNESVLLLEEVIKLLPRDIAEDQCRLWWKANGFRNTIVCTLARRYQVDPLATEADRLGINLIRAIHAATQLPGLGTGASYEPNSIGYGAHYHYSLPAAVTGAAGPQVVVHGETGAFSQ